MISGGERERKQEQMTLARRRPGGRRGAGGWKRMAVYFVGLEE